MKRFFTAVLSPRESGFDVRVPGIRGCVTSGATLEEAIAMATDAANGCLCVLEDANLPLPQDDLVKPADLNADDLTTLIPVDTNLYRQRSDTHAVRKTISMPAWMAKEAARRKVNLSQTLQNALAELLEA